MSFELHHLLYVLADHLSDGINPLFVGLIVQEPLVAGQGKSAKSQIASALLFYLRSLLAVGIAVTLAELGKKHQIWPGHPYFPSGHTTFAAAAATCIVIQRGWGWAWMVVPLVLLMAGSLVYGRWHTLDEVAAAMLLGPLVAWWLMRVTSSWRGR